MRSSRAYQRLGFDSNLHGIQVIFLAILVLDHRYCARLQLEEAVMREASSRGIWIQFNGMSDRREHTYTDHDGHHGRSLTKRERRLIKALPVEVSMISGKVVSIAQRSCIFGNKMQRESESANQSQICRTRARVGVVHGQV
jgi:hypothetical protein